MGKQIFGRKKPSFGRGSGQGKAAVAQKDPLHHVPKFKFFSKNALAPYPSEDGCPFYLGEADDEKSFFKKGHIAQEVVSADTCEALWRLGMSVALYASACHVGGGALLGHVDDRGRVGEKTGLTMLCGLLRSPEGQDFLKAVKTLNVGIGGRVSQKEANVAVKNYVSFLTKKEPQLRKAVSRAASFTAKVYQATMCIAEHMDLLACPKAWADQMQGGRNQPATTQKWIRDPKDQGKLIAAMTDSFLKKMEGSKKPKGSKRAAADSTDDEDEEGSSGDESGSARASEKSDNESASASDAEVSDCDDPKKKKGRAAEVDSEPKKIKKGRSSGGVKGAAPEKGEPTSAKKSKEKTTEDAESDVEAGPSRTNGRRLSLDDPKGRKRRRSAATREDTAVESEKSAGSDDDAEPPKASGKKDLRGGCSTRRSGADSPEKKSMEIKVENGHTDKKARGKHPAPAAAIEQAISPLENPFMLINANNMNKAVAQWGMNELKNTSDAVDAALAVTNSLGDVQDLVAGMPPAIFVSSGISSWRRRVLDLTGDPGAPACQAYVRVLRMILDQAVELQRGDSPAAGTPPLATAGDTGLPDAAKPGTPASATDADAATARKKSRRLDLDDPKERKMGRHAVEREDTFDKKQKLAHSKDEAQRAKVPGKKEDKGRRGPEIQRSGDSYPEKKPEMNVDVSKMQLVLTEWRESDMQETSATVETALTKTVALEDATRLETRNIQMG